MLFGAIAVAGAITTGYMATMKGPGRALSEASKEASIENAMLAATRLVIAGDATQADCDGDGTVEPLPFRAGAGPTGGGLVPLESGAVKNDPWGKALGYCVWDHGKKTKSDNITNCGGSSANRLQGGNISTEIVLAIVSAGKDGIFQTTCNAWADANTDRIADTPLIVTSGDDIVRRDTMETLLASGVLTQLPNLPDSACNAGSVGTMRYTDGIPQVCTSTGWKEIGGATNAANNFADVTNAVVSSVQTSNTIVFSGFFGTRTATVNNGASIIVNGADMGATTEIAPGDNVALKITASATPFTTTTYSLKVGTITKPWNVTTVPASCVLDGQTVNNGNSYTFFNTQLSTNCAGASQSRTCTNGVLGGNASYQYASCTVPANCTLDGQTVNHGDSYTFYSTQSDANCGSFSQSRTCNNGTLNGSSTYQYAACSGGGEIVFEATGPWTVPPGVTSISAVCVGRGGSGHASSRNGGRGGDLRYAVALSVTPGESLTVTIPATQGAGAATIARGGTTLLSAASGAGTGGSTVSGTSSTIGGNIGGGNGGNGGPSNYPGGGGAGGYSGNGGIGAGGGPTTNNPGAGSGGGGGGGSYAGGGGVGLLGQGANGAAGVNSCSSTGNGGRGGSGGGNAADGGTGSSGCPKPPSAGANYGGGGTYSGYSGAVSAGGSSACRIIWGAGRAYPSTNTGDVTCVLDGQTVANGSSYTFYSSPIHADCASIGQSRTCTNGVLGGSSSYSYAACTIPDPCETGAVGSACSDGALYAGNAPDGNRMYVSPSDDGTSMPWNSGSTSASDTALANCSGLGGSGTGCNAGYDNTTLLYNLGTSPAPRPYTAARLCRDKGADWYLPSINEWQTLYNNRVALGGFSTAVRYWSSSETDSQKTWTYLVNSGAAAHNYKYNNYLIRCVRR